MKHQNFKAGIFSPPSSSALSRILPGIFLPVQPDEHFTKTIKTNPTNYHWWGFKNTAFACDVYREENTAQMLP